ncbi:MAG TPA: long-chain fatty acid--CoA ligase [bacterium]|nr:long-chain fatty acid--CoA ligase [bacterium]
METLRDLFEHIVTTNPSGKELLRTRAGRDWRGYTVVEFADATRHTAARLAQAGIEKGDRVALFAENRPEWHIIDFACHLLGAVLVPLYPSLPANQVQYIVADSGAKMLLVSGKDRARTAADAGAQLPGVRIVGIDPGLANGLPALQELPGLPGGIDALPQPALRADELASLIYTSGTTGEPKGVMLSHRNFVSQITSLRPEYPITDADDTLSFLPLSHIFQRILDYLFLYCGCRITYVEAVERVSMMLPLVQPTILASVPRVYERAYVQVLARVQKEGGAKQRLFTWALRAGRAVKAAEWAGRRPPLLARLQYALARRLVFSKILERFGGRLRFSVSGGAPIAREIAEFFDIVGLPVLNGYGLTESAPVIAVNRLESNKLGSVGLAPPGVEVKIAPDGEILARGPNIMMGYWNKPEATAEAIDAGGWLHTGDIGHLDEQEFLFITDRKKDLIVTTGGKNVAPQPIEARLAASPFVAQAVAIGDKYPYLVALVVPNFEAVEARLAEQGTNGALSHEAIAAHPVTEALIASTVKEINADLAAYERIRRFTVLPKEFTLDAGEITPTLKVRRKVIMQRYGDIIEQMYLKSHRTGEYGLDD